MDFIKKMDSTLNPFIEKKSIKSEVALLDLGDPNVWIDAINPEWSGSIPATIIFSKDKSIFYEKDFHSTSELEDIINPFLNH